MKPFYFKHSLPLLLLPLLPLLAYGNPTTLSDEASGFYRNDSGTMLPYYETRACQEVVNQLPIDAICIIALERHKDGKALIEYKGQRGWVDAHNPEDGFVLMRPEELAIPLAPLCTQVGPYFFEIKSIQPGKAVKIYTRPSTTSPVITTIDDHESCLINLGCDWPWCRIALDGGVGWVLGINLTDRIEHVDGYCYPREKIPLEP